MEIDTSSLGTSRRVNFGVAYVCAALLKLRDDIQTCGYEDVQVMWEMLRRTESELITHRPKRKPRPFWRIFVWHRHNAASSFSL
ncbi:hypothetical protein RJ639_010539 [Escallonia herrerae]|uniref:Uncharacterized protein n=1 Tax=Escallonia herrerae TaxID=1293975 RepID=A0AA89ARS2_9ASTE|nr:hypothetical protein RJ639_010539 [Escallonia herrerae]